MAVEVKICGLRDEAALDAAIDAGASLIGLVFYPPSPRHVDIETARRLADHARGRAKVVALLVDPEDDLVDDIVAAVRPDMIQLHGSESPERVAAVRGRAGLPVIKAIKVATAEDAAEATRFRVHADIILFDAKPPAANTGASTEDEAAPLPGGNGMPFDWQALAGAREAGPFMLAGGLTAENVGEAIRRTGAAMVDVSSGVERAPGEKDRDAIRRFLAAVVLASAGAQAENEEDDMPETTGAEMTGAEMTGAKTTGAETTGVTPNSYRTGPDENGHFGIHGGRFVAETLMPLILDLERAYEDAKKDPAFAAELNDLLTHYGGRPSPLYFAERLTEHFGGAKIYFKRDELNHTGSHKINNCLGQIQLARRMGKTRIIAETGAGQHGVAVATVATRFGLPCVIYMGATDIERQKPNVFRMRLLGAEVKPVTSGTGTLKDAMNEALRDWVSHVADTFYIIGTVAGPHPYPAMVRDFQSVIGEEVREQILEREGRLPDTLVACIGGGSNAMGLFHTFLDDTEVAIYGVEAAGKGLETGEHCASLNGGRPGVLHGNRTYLLQNEDGQILDGHSISAGLDYPGIGPEHAWLRETGRVNYVAVTDSEALEAFQLCTRLEGIIPALEPAHALAHVKTLAPQLPSDNLLVMNMCGRGDKDVFAVAGYLGMEI